MKLSVLESDMRHAPRLPVELLGWIVSDDGRSKPCLVSNLSSDGAKLTVLTRDQLPAQFTLSVEGVRHRTRLVWHTGLHAGVQFVRDATIAGALRPLDHLTRISPAGRRVVTASLQ
jgi:hypothetical protein